MKFSVLLPTRNRLDLLSYAIETVRRQDYKDWEIVISDNFSEEDVEGYISSLNEPRIKYIKTEEFIPVTDNWNNALEYSTGDYVVMLGDDDGLLKGYFQTMKSLIEHHNEPDAIYNNALLFAYPGVLPDSPEGFVRSYKNRDLFKVHDAPYLLGNNERQRLLESSLNFRMDYDYNMQFSLVSRKFINNLASYGPFYQSPYPDYYATNVLLLEAERILVTPVEMVAIGISPKSFGYYYFNDAEDHGNQFLKNIPDKSLINKLKKIILPGTEMNTNWLLALETLSKNFNQKHEVKLNYRRYRHIQVCSVLSDLLINKRNAKMIKQKLINKLGLMEKLKYGLFFITIPKLIPKKLTSRIHRKIIKMANSHPAVHMNNIKGEYKNMIDVYEKFMTSTKKL